MTDDWLLDLPIERGIPISPRQRGAGGYSNKGHKRSALSRKILSLGIGDSVLFPNSIKATVIRAKASQIRKWHNIGLVTRKTNKGVRVWRTE